MILRFCVIGNSESIFLKAFLLSVAKRYQYSSFQVLTPKSTTFKYPENIQQFVYSKKGKLFSKISKSSFFFHLINQWIFFRNSIVFDVCHIHSVGTASSILATLMAKKCRFIISSVWGSDFYRSSRMKRRIQEKLYLVSRFITFANEKSLLEFDNYYAGKYSQKLKICRFGLTAFKELKNLEFDKSYCKRQLNIPDSDLVITIGYNNSPGQQHIKVIESLVKHKKNAAIKASVYSPNDIRWY